MSLLTHSEGETTSKKETPSDLVIPGAIATGIDSPTAQSVAPQADYVQIEESFATGTNSPSGEAAATGVAPLEIPGAIATGIDSPYGSSVSPSLDEAGDAGTTSRILPRRSAQIPGAIAPGMNTPTGEEAALPTPAPLEIPGAIATGIDSPYGSSASKRELDAAPTTFTNPVCPALAKISRACGCLYPYTQDKKLKNGTLATFPRVQGERDPNNPKHWYWGYIYHVKDEDGYWKNEKFSVKQKLVPLVERAIAARKTIHEIKTLIKSSQ